MPMNTLMHFYCIKHRDYSHASRINILYALNMVLFTYPAIQSKQESNKTEFVVLKISIAMIQV